MYNKQLKDYINSCFNYTGNKYKQLPQLFSLFPDSTDTFIDLFCGGGVVGLNSIKHMNASKVILNDKSSALISIFQYFKGQNYESVYNDILHIIQKYGLTNTSKYSYKHYNADSSKGLSHINKKGFTTLRDDFNNYQSTMGYPRALLLYVLIVFSFNNQIRFNRHKEFNLPVGKRDFNNSMQKKLSNFMTVLSSSDVTLHNKDFSQIDIPQNAFVYCDPPYSITTATYNERNLWSNKDDNRLFDFLDHLDNRGIPFALSNVLYHNGSQNEGLFQWSKKYHIHPIDFNYNNSNYHSKAKEHTTKEILITNY